MISRDSCCELWCSVFISDVLASWTAHCHFGYCKWFIWLLLSVFFFLKFDWCMGCKNGVVSKVSDIGIRHPSSISSRFWLCLLRPNAPGKSMNLFPFDICKIAGLFGLFKMEGNQGERLFQFLLEWSGPRFDVRPVHPTIKFISDLPQTVSY